MTTPASTSALELVCERHLIANELTCAEHNIVVRVESLSADRCYAICSVQQHRHGFFRREREVQDLVWQAEQALAPLMAAGIVPLINVRHRSLGNRTNEEPALKWMRVFDLMPNLMAWLGYPSVRQAIPVRVISRDPFGWRHVCVNGPR